MKKLTLFLFLVFVGTSCNRTYEAYLPVCSCIESEKASEFVRKSILNSNNMSDEEMEDVISQLHKTAIALHCKKRNITITYNSQSGGKTVVTKLDSCETVHFMQ